MRASTVHAAETYLRTGCCTRVPPPEVRGAAFDEGIKLSRRASSTPRTETRGDRPVKSRSVLRLYTGYILPVLPYPSTPEFIRSLLQTRKTRKFPLRTLHFRFQSSRHRFQGSFERVNPGIARCRIHLGQEINKISGTCMVDRIDRDPKRRIKKIRKMSSRIRGYYRSA